VGFHQTVVQFRLRTEHIQEPSAIVISISYVYALFSPNLVTVLLIFWTLQGISPKLIQLDAPGARERQRDELSSRKRSAVPSGFCLAVQGDREERWFPSTGTLLGCVGVDTLLCGAVGRVAKRREMAVARENPHLSCFKTPHTYLHALPWERVARLRLISSFKAVN
jgi:hypothetical protein